MAELSNPQQSLAWGKFLLDHVPRQLIPIDIPLKSLDLDRISVNRTARAEYTLYIRCRIASTFVAVQGEAAALFLLQFQCSTEVAMSRLVASRFR